jgi:hypothetical protein
MPLSRTLTVTVPIGYYQQLSYRAVRSAGRLGALWYGAVGEWHRLHCPPGWHYWDFTPFFCRYLLTNTGTLL